MEHVLQVDVIAVTFVASWVIPLAVGLLTKSRASSSVKAVLNLVLTVATGVCACIIQAKGSVTVGQITTAVMAAFTGSGLSYQHLWKPTGIAASVANAAPDLGLGTQGPEPVGVEGGSTTTHTTDTTLSSSVTSVSHFEPDVPTDAPPVAVDVAVSVPVAPDPVAASDAVPMTAHAAQDLADKSLLTGSSFLAIITPVASSEDV